MLNEKHFGPIERVMLVKMTPCLICRQLPSENAHLVSRGAGGTYKDIIPLCHKHHSQLDIKGRTSFEAIHNINLDVAVVEFQAKLEEML